MLMQKGLPIIPKNYASIIGQALVPGAYNVEDLMSRGMVLGKGEGVGVCFDS